MSRDIMGQGRGLWQQQAADEDKVMRKAAFFHPFQAQAEEFFDGEADVAAERFDGIAHFFRETAGGTLGLGAAGAFAAASGGEADTAGVELFFGEKLVGELLFFGGENLVQDFIQLFLGVGLGEGVIVKDDFCGQKAKGFVFVPVLEDVEIVGRAGPDVVVVGTGFAGFQEGGDVYEALKEFGDRDGGFVACGGVHESLLFYV